MNDTSPRHEDEGPSQLDGSLNLPPQAPSLGRQSDRLTTTTDLQLTPDALTRLEWAPDLTPVERWDHQTGSVANNNTRCGQGTVLMVNKGSAEPYSIKTKCDMSLECRKHSINPARTYLALGASHFADTEVSGRPVYYAVVELEPGRHEIGRVPNDVKTKRACLRERVHRADGEYWIVYNQWTGRLHVWSNASVVPRAASSPPLAQEELDARTAYRYLREQALVLGEIGPYAVSDSDGWPKPRKSRRTSRGGSYRIGNIDPGDQQLILDELKRRLASHYHLEIVDLGCLPAKVSSEYVRDEAHVIRREVPDLRLRTGSNTSPATATQERLWGSETTRAPANT